MRNFTLFSLIRIAMKHIVILIVAAIIFAGCTFAYCEFVALPIYSAEGTLLVTNGALLSPSTQEDGNIENTDIVASLNFTDTVIDILKMKDIYKKLSNEIDNKYTYGNLASRTNIDKSNDNSLFLSVTVTANTSEEAISLVNSYLALAPEHIKQQIPNAAVSINETDSASQTYPRTIIFSGIAGIIGAVVAFGILLLIYSTNSIIRGEEDFAERFDIEVIGSIPDFARARADKYYRSSYYNGYYGKGGYGYGDNKE